MKKIKILIADNIPLTPHRQGGPVRIFKNFNYIPDNFDIYYIGCSGDEIEPAKNRIKEENIQTVKNKYVHYFLYEYILKQNNKLLKGGSFYDTLTRIMLLHHKRYNKRLKAIAQNANVLIASHPWTFTSLKKIKTKKQIIIYDAHNCEYQLLKDKYKGILGFIIKKWTKKIEKEACQKSDIIFACSENESKNFTKYYHTKEKKIYIVPNSVETDKFSPATQEKKEIYKKKHGFSNCQCVLFIATNYFPNNDAADFIIEKLALKLKHLHFIIIGSVKVHFERTRKKIPNNVHVMGQVTEEHMQELAKMCDIALNPIVLGSGTNIKLLDYMAWGIPCITTARGVRGMGVMNQKEVSIIPRDKFFGEIIKLLEHPHILKKIKKNGLIFVKKNYDAKRIGTKIGMIISQYLHNTKNNQK